MEKDRIAYANYCHSEGCGYIEMMSRIKRVLAHACVLFTIVTLNNFPYYVIN